MDGEGIFEGLNPEQRRAVEAVRGPVVILAGAGSGKTTTITRRIAWQVASRTFAAHEILAVTFTDKAAGEMRARLARLGVDGIRARTFHASALQQLHYFGRGPGGVLPSKALMLRHIANSLPRPFRFRPAADIATEIEWAKNRRMPPERYEQLAGERLAAPLPPDLMGRVYREYERRKAERGLVDFEDLLELCIRLYDEDANASAEFRSRCRAITVDEFQDVNLLQQELLERWLGPRDELCVVGDDYQAIYGFTGASPQHLLTLRARFANATVVKLEENYRSSPQILELANRLTPNLGGEPKTLRAVRPDGPEPALLPFASRDEEARYVVERIRTLAAEGVPYDEVAILFRLNARSEPWEEALADAEIPYQVRGGPFLARPAARRLRQVLGGSQSTALAEDVRRAAIDEGWAQGEELERVGEYEATRQHDLGRLVGPGPSARGRRAHRRRPLHRARRAFRRGLRRPGSPPAHLPPSEGARVRRRLPARCRGTRAARAPGEDRRGGRGGATAPLRRDHPGEARAGADVERRGQAESLPGRAGRGDSARPAGAPEGRGREPAAVVHRAARVAA